MNDTRFRFADGCHVTNSNDGQAKEVLLYTLILAVGSLFGIHVLAGCSPEMRDGPPRCHGKLRAIGWALLAYYDSYGDVPRVTPGTSDKHALYSWRVLLLPFLEEGTAYADYDLSSPWDSVNNQRFVSRAPQAFQCPRESRSGMTTYYALWCDGPLSPSPSAISARKGLPRNVLIVELPDCAVVWTRPTDSCEDVLSAMNPDELVNCLFADISVHSLKVRDLLAAYKQRSSEFGLCADQATLYPFISHLEEMGARTNSPVD